MDDNEKALVKTLVKAIWADGEMAAEEREMLGGILAQLGASPEEVMEVGAMLQKPPELDDLREQVPDYDARCDILKVVLAMSLADGRVNVSELRFLNKMAQTLEIKDADFAALKEETLKTLEAGA
ncbi:MAG: hypothetical protein AMXMBFR33_62400 [Candidatus Xenobia bacterium]